MLNSIPVASAVFDETIVEEMRSRLGGATLAKLMECFANDLAKAGRELHVSLMLGDRETLKLVAHSLKGLAGQYGARNLADKASELYGRCATTDINGLGRGVWLIQSLCQEAIDDSRKYRHLN